MALAQDVGATKHDESSLRSVVQTCLLRLAGWVLAWRRSGLDQRYLAGLSDRNLEDIGLSRDEVAPPPPPSLWLR